MPLIQHELSVAAHPQGQWHLPCPSAAVAEVDRALPDLLAFTDLLIFSLVACDLDLPFFASLIFFLCSDVSGTSFRALLIACLCAAENAALAEAGLRPRGGRHSCLLLLMMIVGVEG